MKKTILGKSVVLLCAMAIVTPVGTALAEAGGEVKAKMKIQTAFETHAAEEEGDTEAVGSLELSDAPPGASVFVNSTPVGVTPLDAPILLQPGYHRIRVFKVGYSPIETEIEVAPGDELVMNADLLSLAEATLTLECNAEDASIRVGGEAVGACPFTGTFPPGIYEVSINAPGREPVVLKIEAVAGQVRTTAVELQPRLTPPPPVERKPSLGAAWYKLKLRAKNPDIPKEQRIKEIDGFLTDYTPSPKWRKRAEYWKQALEKGYEPESFEDPVYMRSRPDALALKLYGGNYGTGVMIELPTGRWPWFFLGGRLTGGGGYPVREYDDHRLWFALGLHFGVPFSIGKRNLHEIRVGGALMFGYMRDHRGYNDDSALYEEAFSLGPILAPEISYVVHLARRFALQFGIDAFFGLIEGVYNGSSDQKRPTPMISGFIGFRI